MKPDNFSQWQININPNRHLIKYGYLLAGGQTRSHDSTTVVVTVSHACVNTVVLTLHVHADTELLFRLESDETES